jgi:hypothetical protein
MTLKDEHRLKLFENRVLRRIFIPERNEMVRGWRKVHNEELHNSYSSQSVIRIIMKCIEGLVKNTRIKETTTKI